MEAHLKKLSDELKAGQAQLFDVREEQEWEEGHLKDAQLVPLSGLESGSCPKNLDKTRKTYLHCRSGQRVYRAAPLLQKMGFKEVVPLDEGFADLVDEGFPESGE